MRMSFRWWWPWMLAGAVSSCGSSREAEKADPRPEVRVAVMESKTFAGTIEAPGQWKAAVETTIPAPFDCVVETISVRPGDHVVRGATIARLRTSESDAVVRGAELMVRQAGDATSRHEASRALAQAQASVIRVPIAAPATGTVLRRQADPGSRIATGNELLAIVADDAVVFEARVPTEAGAAIHPGMTASIAEDVGSPQAASVWTLPPSSATDQSTLVWLRPRTLPAHPVFGRYGKASILTGRSALLLAVPDSAIVEDDLTGRQRIVVVDSSAVVRWVDIRLGPREGQERAVFGTGLGNGQRVVVDGQRPLVDGMHVAIRP